MVSVTYNSETLPNVYGEIYFANDYTSGTFRCNFLVKGTSAANLVSLCNNLEEKLREPYQDATIVFGGTTEYQLRHSQNEALNTMPSVSIIQSPLQTETSRAYSFELRFEMPADLSGFNFRRFANYTVNENAQKQQTISFSLEYTAGGSDSSSTNFDDHAQTYTDSIVSTFTGTFEIIDLKKSTDQEDKKTTGSITYKEILDSELDGTFNSADILDVTCQYGIQYDQEIGIDNNSEYEQEPKTNITISYSAKINKKTVSVSGIESLWRQTIKPWIIKNAKDVLNINSQPNAGSGLIVMSDTQSFNPTNYTLTGSLTIFSPSTLGQITFVSEKISQVDSSGIVKRKIWDGEHGTYDLWHMGAETTINRTIVVSKLDEEPTPPLPLDESILLLESRRKDREVKRIGDGSFEFSSELFTVEIFTISFSETYSFISNLGGGAGLNIEFPNLSEL